MPALAATPAPVTPEQDLHRALQVGMLRALFSVTAVVCLLGVLVAVAIGGVQQAGTRPLMALGYGSLLAVCLAGLRLPAARASVAIAPVVLGGLVMVTAVAWVSGWGLQTPGLVFFSLGVFLANTIGSGRLGLASTLLALLALLLLGGAERNGLLAMAANAPPLGSRLVVHAAAVLTGALMGRAVARLLRRHLHAADAREQRVRALLGIATNAYWETDAELRLSQVSWRDDAGRFVPVPSVLGRPPWQITDLAFDDDNLDLLQAEMQSRVKLRDLPFCWRRSNGELRHFLASGEPRLDEQGRLLGYWGVARDVSAEHQARLSLAATETRYHDLFKQIPTPLMLHQGGILRDANPAAARLLGYDAVGQMLGLDLVASHILDSERKMTIARIRQAESLPLGQALPAVEISLRTRAGHLVSVRATAVSSEHAGQPAVLSITLDETEQRAASLALARSQALLASVVSLSPDIISLTTLHDGRFVMVNDSFCRLLGHEQAEVVGQTSIEIGVWHDLADRARMIRGIETDGLVLNELVDFVTRQGRLLPLLVSGTRVESGGQAYLLLNARDMSESTRAQLELEAILANASIGIAFTRDLRFVRVNAKFEQMYGWAPGGLAGLPLQALWNDPLHFDALRREVGPALLRGEAVDLERQGRRRDGSGFTARLRAKAIDPLNPANGGTIWIAEDVTAERLADQELARARDAAEAANRAKSAFLANTSHEIRTPLNGVLGLARLARQPGLAPERQRQMLDQICESAEVLAAIISDILDLAKVEAGKLVLEAAPFDLHGLLKSLARDFSALAAGRGLAFDTCFDPALPVWVRGDALRVRQIIVNFLHNALKFTASGGIRLEAHGLPDGGLRFEVHDSGPGIAPAVQARLFEPFTQADESTTRKFGGTGLGLSICRQLASLMGGSVGLSSTAGCGSCFHAELPLPAAQPAADSAAPSAADSASLRGARVLMVEDNSVNMMIGVALLEQWGVDVTEAGDGGAALAAVERAAAQGRGFDAVLMDLQMPGMSGYEATLALRQRYSAEQLPVIALTAAALVSERDHALAIGMNEFLTKPIDPARLQSALLRALARAGNTIAG